MLQRSISTQITDSINLVIEELMKRPGVNVVAWRRSTSRLFSSTTVHAGNSSGTGLSNARTALSYRSQVTLHDRLVMGGRRFVDVGTFCGVMSGYFQTPKQVILAATVSIKPGVRRPRTNSDIPCRDQFLDNSCQHVVVQTWSCRRR